MRAPTPGPGQDRTPGTNRPHAGRDGAGASPFGAGAPVRRAEGAGVVTTRADVHYVVTEFGAVNLFGKNLRERAEALISIAHPKFHAELEQQARDRKLIA